MPATFHIEGTIPKKIVQLTVHDQELPGAVSEFRRQHPAAAVEFVNGQFVRGFCQKCDRPVLECDRDYRYDHDTSTYVCGNCNPQEPS